jgi:putative copper resistance protein D
MTGLGITVRWLHLACGLGLVGLLTALLLAGRSDRPTARAWEARMLRACRLLALLLIASGIAALASQASVVTGRAGAALEPAAWVALLARTQFGTVWLVRHGLLLLLAALLLLREREQSPADRVAFRAQAWLMAALGAAAMAWAGHAAAVEPAGLAAALLDALHLVAAGAWFGALLPLASLLRAASVEAGADARPFAVLAVRRFSPLALATMLLVVATGSANAWFQVGTFPAWSARATDGCCSRRSRCWRRSSCWPGATAACCRACRATRRRWAAPRWRGSGASWPEKPRSRC